MKYEHIKLKYKFSHKKLEDLNYIMYITKEFKSLEDLMKQKYDGIQCNIWLNTLYRCIGYSIKLDYLLDNVNEKEKEVKSALKTIFDKIEIIGTPYRVYGNHKLVESVLLNYDKELGWSIWASKKVIDKK